MYKLKRSVLSVTVCRIFVWSIPLSGTLFAVDGSWNTDSSGNWSTPGNWSSNPSIPGGAGSTVNATNNITSASRTITIDSTSRTVGILNIGDSNGTHQFIVAGSGTSLIFDNSGSPAQLNFVASGGARNDTVSAPILLQDDLNISNAASGGKTVGAISSNSTGTKTLTNQGTGAGNVYVSGVISNGAGAVAVRQNSATSPLGFANNQAFSGGFTLDAGIVQLAQNVSLGSGSVTLNAGTVNLGSTSGGTINNAVQVNGNINFISSVSAGAGNLSLTGTTTITGNRTFNVGKNTLNVTNLVESGGNYTFTKAGAGTVFLGGNASLNHTGGTIIQAGTLSVAGLGNHLVDAAPVTVEGGVFDVSTTETIGVLTLRSGSVTGSTGTFTASSYEVESGTISRALAGSGRTLTKTTSGSVTLSAANTFTGATSVNAGTLVVSGGDINSSAVSVAAGANLVYNSATARTGTLTLGGNGTGAGNRATLSGTGNMNVAITLDNIGDTLSPGNSPGTQNFSVGQTWNSFTYLWETNNFTGTTAGTDFDRITISGALNLTGGLGAYLLDITSLTAGNVAGNVANFSDVNRSWTILTSTGITGFNAANWTVSTNNFLSSPSSIGTWALNQVGNDLVLTYAVPEPSTSILILGSILTLVLVFRRRSKIKSQ